MRALMLVGAAVLLMVVGVPAQGIDDPVSIDLYMTDNTGDVNERMGVRLLSSETPSGAASSQTLSVLPAIGPSSAVWVWNQTAAKDLLIPDAISVHLFLSGSLEVVGGVDVEVFAVLADGSERTIAEGSNSVVLGIIPREETVTATVSDGRFLAGEALGLRVSVAGPIDVVANLDYGGSGSESGIQMLALATLDSDGDGVGDSAERRAGTDPFDANDTPSGGGGDDDDGETGDAWVPIVAALLTLGCVAVGAAALGGRFAA